MKKRIVSVVLACFMAFTALGCGSSKQNVSKNAADYDFTVSYEGIAKKAVGAKVSVHDPSIIEENGVYYIFGSHMATAKSEDGRVWESIGDGYRSTNPVYTDLWAEDSHVFDYAGAATSVIPTDDGGNHVWAPDVIYNETMGCYMMYYCTSSTWNASNLCYATSDSIEGPYTWQGALIYSGFTEGTIGETDVLDYVDEEYAVSNYIKPNGDYNFVSYPNALDPTVFFDEEGRFWMVYGSWSGGIFLLELDKTTGKVIHPEADEEANVDAYFGKKLLGGDHKSIEAPYILYDEKSGYYYLFVSYGGLNRDGGYQIRVFRSSQVNGEYVDMNGSYPTVKDSVHLTFGLKLSGNYSLPSINYSYKATGHNSAMINENGQYLICYHTRFDTSSEYFEPRVKQFFLNKEGWPCVMPYAFDGEVISETGYSMDEMAGMYYLVNQGVTIDAEVAEPIKVMLFEDGTVLGDGVSGTWTTEKDTYYMTFTYGKSAGESITYSGVFCKQNDEAGTEVMTFSAVGNNISVWGVKYDEK